MKKIGSAITLIGAIWFLYLGYRSSGFESDALLGLSVLMAAISRIEWNQ